jgi:hypothetical protein
MALSFNQRYIFLVYTTIICLLFYKIIPVNFWQEITGVMIIKLGYKIIYPTRHGKFLIAISGRGIERFPKKSIRGSMNALSWS